MVHLPVGWDRRTLSIDRSQTWHYCYPTSEQTLEFVKEGADYLTKAYEAESLQALVYLDVYREDSQDLQNVLDKTYKIKFKEYKRDHIGTVFVGLEQESFAQELKDAEKVKVDLTRLKSLHGDLQLPPLPYRDIALHSKAILKHTQMNHVGGKDGVEFRRDVNSRDAFTETYLKYTLLSTDNKTAEEIQESISHQSYTAHSMPDSDNSPPVVNAGDKRPVFIFKENGYLNLSYSFDFTFNVGWAGEMNCKSFAVMRIIRANGTDETLIRSEIAQYGNAYFGLDPNFTQNKTINLKKDVSAGIQAFIGDEVYCYIETEIVHTSYKFREGLFNWDSYFTSVGEDEYNIIHYKVSASAITSTEGTTSKAIYFGDAYSRVIESITGKIGSFDNSFYELFDGYRSTATADKLAGKRLLMGGIHARGWDFSEMPLTVTLADLFETAHTIDAVGMGVKKVDKEFKAYVAPIKEFYSDVVSLRLGVVTNLSKQIDLDKTYSQVKIGYNKFDTDSTNSLDEFNTDRDYKSYISNHDHTYEAISPIRTDGYGFETARRQGKEANPNKSTPYDKDTFLVCFERSGGKLVSEDGSIFLDVSGLLDPATAYNARITPARCFRKHEPLFMGCLQKAPDKALQFTDSAVVTRMSSQIAPERNMIVERGTRRNKQHANPLFWNELYEFEYTLTEEEVKQLEENPHGTIVFEDELRNVKQGFLRNVSIDFNNLAKFTLQRKFVVNG